MRRTVFSKKAILQRITHNVTFRPTETVSAADARPNVNYMVHLDGIRALAVTAVVLEHWASGLPAPIRRVINTLDLGGWGVECFFVLSGFLITLILLNLRNNGAPLKTNLWHFYARRALRIFPAYYLTIFILALTIPSTREVILWNIFYLGNFYPLWHHNFIPDTGHFWSLAVEEQYYLFWPLVVLLMPNRRVMQLALILCVLGPFSRFLLWQAMSGPHLTIYTFPTAALDLLGFGAFLACVKHEYGISRDHVFTRTLNSAAVIALIIYVSTYVLDRQSVAFSVAHRSLAAVVFGALVWYASFGFQGSFKFFFNNRIIIWIGTISYGIYIYHPYVPALYVEFLSSFELPLATWGTYYIRYPLMALALLTIAAASFYAIERPIRNRGTKYT